MKKTKTARTIAALLALASVITLAGCAKKAATIVSPKPAPTIVTEENVREAAHGASAGVSDFAFRLAAELVAERDDENLIFSPISVWLPLAALANATDDANRDALLSALGVAGANAGELNAMASSMLEALLHKPEHVTSAQVPLRIVNAIFVSQNEKLKSTFSQAFAGYFGGTAMNIDFASPSAVDAVNKWVSENTDGLIQNVVDEFDQSAVAVIANAVYFSDRWAWEFREENTREMDFHSPTGVETAHFMLRDGDEQQYYEDDELQAMPLHFKTGGTMYILLPRDGDAAGLLSELTSERFDEICTSFEERTGTLLLPRFTADSGVMTLGDALKTLGVPLFDKALAPLTGGLIESADSVWIDAAVQKAYIEVDEKGTTAAAVTVMAMISDDLPMPDEAPPFEMTCDKPFVYVLCGSVKGENVPLFIGIVNHAE